MSDRDWYRGMPKSSTVLVFGEVFDDRPPITHAIQFGQEAYETYQTKAYLDGLFQTRHHPTYVDWSPLFCALYAGIVATGARQVVELGSTLFATIDKLEKLQRLANGPAVRELEFIGIKPSRLFCQLAEALHPSSRIRHVNDLRQLPPVPLRSVNRCYQSSSYALDSTAALVNYCATSDFGSQGIWFSHDGTSRSVSVMGKPLTLFSLSEFLDGMRARGYLVEFVQKSRSAYAGEFQFYEAWLIYHKFTAAQLVLFRDWLGKLQNAAQDGSQLYPDFDSAPLIERADSGFAGLSEDSRRLDFTTDYALRKLAAWRGRIDAEGGDGPRPA